MEKEIKNFLKQVKTKKWKTVKRFLTQKHASEAAEFFEKINIEYQSFIYRFLPKQFSTKMFAYLSARKKHSLIKQLTTKEIKEILSGLAPDDRTELFEDSHHKVTKRLLSLLNKDDLKEAKSLLKYPEQTIGRLMTPNFLSVRQDWTVEKAMKHIHENGKEAETIDMIYVVDRKGKLIDDLKIKKLILANPKTKIKELTTPQFTSLSAFDDQEKALPIAQKHNLVALPVVDKKGILLGIVTVDDLIDTGEEETTEDFHKIGAVSVNEKEGVNITNLLEASLWIIYRARIAWLMLLVGVNIFSGAAISLFEDIISRSIALVFFLPLLIGSGGNAGAQASTLMIRALSTGDVEIHDWFKLILKEILISVGLGVTMAIGVSLIGIFRGGPEIAVVTAISMVSIVVMGSLIGMSLPFLFTKFNKDPATASAPLITCIADIFGVLIYFSVAKWYLGL